MKYKKFLIIPVLIFIYIIFVVDFLVNYSPMVYSQPSTQPFLGGQIIGVGTAVSVSVIRPYLFGLIRLPVYSEGIGYIGNYHEAFFYFIGILTVIFIVIELIKWRKK